MRGIQSMRCGFTLLVKENYGISTTIKQRMRDDLVIFWTMTMKSIELIGKLRKKKIIDDVNIYKSFAEYR